MIYLKDQYESIPLLKDVDLEIDEINKKLDNVCFERISTKNYVVEKYTNGDFKSYGNFKITSTLDFIEIGSTKIYYAPYVNGYIGINTTSIYSVVCNVTNNGIIWHGPAWVESNKLRGYVVQCGNSQYNTYIRYVIYGKWN